MRLEPERGGVDVAERAICLGRAAGGDRKPVNAIAVVGDLLKVIEVHPHLVFTACDLRRVCSALEDRGNDDRVAACEGRSVGNDERVAD